MSKCNECGGNHDPGGARIDCINYWKQRAECLEVEVQSRAHWIKEMNGILGYNNDDGFHGEPGPHTIATNVMKALNRIATYPIHSEPIGGAMDMQNIAYESLKHFRQPTL